MMSPTWPSSPPPRFEAHSTLNPHPNLGHSEPPAGGGQIRTFKMNYKRIFGLKESHFVTIDPANFEVTNTFDYADLKSLKAGSS